MEALYDTVYARAFADAWAASPDMPAVREQQSAAKARAAATAAVRSFSFKDRDAVLVAKGQEP